MYYINYVYLPTHRKGHTLDLVISKQDDKIIMVATDNLSTFDHVMDNLIPYKGIILNMFAQRSFEQVKDILPSAMLDAPDPNVVVQKKLKNV